MNDSPEGRGRDLEGRIALVTGTSRGLGREVAMQLGARGAHVIAVARTVGGLEELDEQIRLAGGETAVLAPLDLTDGDGLDRMGAALFQRFGRLDLLVHAAAEGASLTPVSHLRPKDLDKMFAVNALATARLIRSLAPLLERSEDARAVFVTHDRAGQALWGAYAASKAAGASFAAAYGAESPKVAVSLFEPPAMATALRARTHPGEDREALTPVRDVAARLIGTLLG